MSSQSRTYAVSSEAKRWLEANDAKLRNYVSRFFLSIKCRDTRDDAIQETLCCLFQEIGRLESRGEPWERFPFVTAKFCALAWHQGRRFVRPGDANDALRERKIQRRNHDHQLRYSDHSQVRTYLERDELLADESTNPATLARVRLDFASWLETLTVDQVEALVCLMNGETMKGMRYSGKARLTYGECCKSALLQHYLAFVNGK